MSDAVSAPPAVEAAQARIVELFGHLCANPDDRGLAKDTDQALRTLEELLTTFDVT